MSSSAHVVVLGAGVVGASVAYHLAELGRTDVVVVDKGPIPATGGSSSHAPGLAFQTDPSKMMTELARYTVELYMSLGRDEPAFLQVGGIEVASTRRRWRELQRKHGLATSWGLDAELLSPDAVAARVPLVDPEQINGGYFVPTDGLVKAVRGVDAMLRHAERKGVRLLGDTEVTGFDLREGRVQAVRTTAGDIVTPIVVCCAGIWGPKVGRMAGVSIPVQPLAHQYAWTTPVPQLAGADSEATHPILRHQDVSMYMRQSYDTYGVGSYQHRAIPIRAEDIPPAARATGGGAYSGMPSVMAFTPDDFAKPWQDACNLLPPLADTKVDTGMNGLFLFTHDGAPVLGESRTVGGFWVAEAVLITHSGGVGRAIAEWLVEGRSQIDLRGADLHRYEQFQHAPAYVEARGSQNFIEVYDIIHPLQPMEDPRPLRVSPFYLRQREQAAFFLEAMGWERPHWFEANADLTHGREIPGRDEWSAQYWSPIVAAEHLATRERVAMYDMTSLYKLEVTGSGALHFLDNLVTNNIDKPVGAVTYTAMCDESGGVRSDLTIARLGDTQFQVGANGPLDLDWLERHRPAGDSVAIRNITGATCCLGLWGPKARDVLAAVCADDVSHQGFRFFTARQLWIGEIPVTALRLSYVGELGWELYTSAEYGLRLWDLLWKAGQDHGILAGGRGAFNSLRIEKGYRSWDTDMWAEHTPYEAGLGPFVKLDKGPFIGREPLTAARENGPRRHLVCLVLDDPSKLVMGSEPVFVDGEARGFVTSAAHGYAVGESIAYAWLPAEHASHGTPVEIAYFGEHYPAQEVSEPRFDPEMKRMLR
jgi:glycine cleavage system aminomethyltransferase T/glycine/D-amino acid oxidase-like deaminating enzyme